jgi:hypothetical protein
MDAEAGNVTLAMRLMKEKLVVEDDIAEGTMHVQSVVVVNEAHLAEPIHEETESWWGSFLNTYNTVSLRRRAMAVPLRLIDRSLTPHRRSW